MALMLCAGSTLGANKYRTGTGGTWDDGTMWNPMGVPQTGDDCFHDDQAASELLFDGYGVGGPKPPGSFTATPGGTPPRALRIAPGRFLTVQNGGFFVGLPQLALEEYEITLASDPNVPATTAIDVQGLCTGGNWTMEEGTRVRVTWLGPTGPNGIHMRGGTWTIGPGASVVEGSAFTIGGIIGDFVNSRITLQGAGARVESDDFISVAYLRAAPGSIISILSYPGNVAVWRDLVLDGAEITAPDTGVRDITGIQSATMTMRNGASVNGDLSIGTNTTLAYGGLANRIESPFHVSIDASGVLIKETPSSELTLAFDDASLETDTAHFDQWDATGVTLECIGNSFPDADSVLEVTYGDFGNGILFVDVPCVWYKELIVRAAAPENPPTVLLLEDFYDNAFHGSPPATDVEALYIHGDVTIEPGSTLDLSGFNVYYTGTLTADPNQIIGAGSIIQVPALNYGDFDGDCDVDTADFAVFSQNFTGSGGLAANPLTDRDCDRDTDTADFARFSQNFTGSGTGCGGAQPLSGGSSGGGSMSPADIAAWCNQTLDARSRGAFATRIEAILDAEPNRPDPTRARWPRSQDYCNRERAPSFGARTPNNGAVGSAWCTTAGPNGLLGTHSLARLARQSPPPGPIMLPHGRWRRLSTSSRADQPAAAGA